MFSAMQKPAVIFFDAVGTLFGVRGTVGKVYGEIAAGYGVEVSANALDWAFGQVFREVGSPAFPGAQGADIPRLEWDWWRRVAIETFDRAGVLMQFEDFDPFLRSCLSILRPMSLGSCMGIRFRRWRGCDRRGWIWGLFLILIQGCIGCWRRWIWRSILVR